MNDIRGEQEVNVLFDFLNAYFNRRINVWLGHYDPDDDKAIVINGTLLIFDNEFLGMKDENGKNMIIPLRYVRFISEGWSDDIVSVDEEPKA